MAEWQSCTDNWIPLLCRERRTIMLLKHFFIGKIAHSSYILAGRNYCAVIDPPAGCRCLHRRSPCDGSGYHPHPSNPPSRRLHIGTYGPGKKDRRKNLCGEIGKVHLRSCAPVGWRCHRMEDMVSEGTGNPRPYPEHLSYVLIDKSRSDSPLGVCCGRYAFCRGCGKAGPFSRHARGNGGKTLSQPA